MGEYETVCNPCDRKLAAEWKVEQDEKARVWGERRKCKYCKCALPVSRWLVCHNCVSDFEIPDDVPYADQLPATSPRGVYFGVGPAQRLSTGHKKCPKCLASKPTHMFKPDKKRKDGVYPYCKECQGAVWSERNAKAKERLKQLKEKETSDDLPTV